jgi:hypothetical protein
MLLTNSTLILVEGNDLHMLTLEIKAASTTKVLHFLCVHHFRITANNLAFLVFGAQRTDT